MTRGRPRDNDLTERVLADALLQLSKGGYEALNIEALAASAGTSRTAIYRRWPNRRDLALAAIEHVAEVGEAQLAHSVAENLANHAMQNNKNLTANDLYRDYRSSWPAVLSPQILELYLERIGNRRMANGKAIIAQAVERGELPRDVDGDLIVDAMAGYTVYRNTVFGTGITHQNALRLARSLCEAPPRLPANRLDETS